MYDPFRHPVRNVTPHSPLSPRRAALRLIRDPNTNGNIDIDGVVDGVIVAHAYAVGNAYRDTVKLAHGNIVQFTDADAVIVTHEDVVVLKHGYAITLGDGHSQLVAHGNALVVSDADGVRLTHDHSFKFPHRDALLLIH